MADAGAPAAEIAPVPLTEADGDLNQTVPVCNRCKTYPGSCEEYLGVTVNGSTVDPRLRAESYQFYANVTRTEIKHIVGPIQDWANEVLEDTAGEKIQRRSSSVAVANESKKGPTKFNHLEGDSGVIAFLTDTNIASLRDLRGEHIPLLREALQEGAVAMQEMSAKEQQADAHPPVKMVAFVEYPPVCRPLHIVFRKEEIQAETREKRRFGPSALYLVEDILEKLGTGAGDFYAGACIVANYTGMAGMAKELVAHSHVVNASHPFRGKPPTSKTARSNATGRKTRWLAEARPAAPLKKASNVHVIRPGVGGASRTWKKVVDLFLTETSLQFRDGDQGCEYSLDDIYAARMDKDDNHNLVIYHAYTKKPGTDFRRECDNVILKFQEISEAKEWELALQWLVATGRIGTGEVPGRKLLMFVNPVGGKGKAKKIYAEKVAPMLEKSHVVVDMIETEHMFHARDYVAECPLEKLYDGVVTVSGDGLLNEVVQGMMLREDSTQARKVPIAAIPGGSGNGLAVSLKTPCPVSATWNVIKGAVRGLDMMSVRQGDKVHWAFLSIALGLVADIDIESEKWRWMGETRFTVAAIPRILRLRKYPVTLSYLKATRGEPMPHAEANEDGRGLRSHFVGANFEDDSKWEKVDGDFLNFLALNTEWLSSSFKAGAYTSLNDGYMDLVWIMRGVRTGEVLDVLLDEGSSNWVKKPYVKYAKTRAFKIEPKSDKGILSNDGELLEYAPAFVEVHAQAFSLMVPRTACIPDWNVDDLEGFSDDRKDQRAKLPVNRFQRVTAV